MRIFAVPASHVELLESEIARVVDEIRQDLYRREHGHAPLFNDVFVQLGREGIAFAVVGQASDNLVAGVAQAKEKARAERRSA